MFRDRGQAKVREGCVCVRGVDTCHHFDPREIPDKEMSEEAVALHALEMEVMAKNYLEASRTSSTNG